MQTTNNMSITDKLSTTLTKEFIYSHTRSFYKTTGIAILNVTFPTNTFLIKCPKSETKTQDNQILVTTTFRAKKYYIPEAHYAYKLPYYYFSNSEHLPVTQSNKEQICSFAFDQNKSIFHQIEQQYIAYVLKYLDNQNHKFHKSDFSKIAKNYIFETSLNYIDCQEITKEVSEKNRNEITLNYFLYDKKAFANNCFYLL